MKKLLSAVQAVLSQWLKAVTAWSIPAFLALDRLGCAIVNGPTTIGWYLARGPPDKAGQRGSVNVGGIMMLGIAMVFLAIGFIFLPISTDATQDLLDYAYSGNAAITDASYTGFTSVVGITPLLILVGFLCAAVVTGMLGVKVMKGAASTAFSPGSLMMLGLSIIFIAVGLIIEPVMLDGVSSVYHGGGTGISSDFTGYESILLVAPLLVHIAFLAAAVLSGFFGIKNLSRSTM